eukprot:9607241-Heterocapsa_arctica.AAC.1
MPCIVIDDLNACFNIGSDGKWTGLRHGIESRVYVCTGSAEQWDIVGEDGVNYDKAAADVRDWATQKGIVTWSGKELWDDLAPYKQSWNAFHHGEPGTPCNIAWLWDR